MQETSKQIILDFITTEFKMKRVRNEKNKWSNAIVIPKGYVRNNKKYYKTNDNLNYAMALADIIATVVNVFGVSTELSKNLAQQHLSKINFD